MDIAGLNFKNSFVLTLVIEERVSWMVDIHYIVMWSRSPRSPHTTKYEFLMIHSLSLLWLAGQSQVIAKVSNPTVQHFSTYSTHHTGQICLNFSQLLGCSGSVKRSGVWLYHHDWDRREHDEIFLWLTASEGKPVQWRQCSTVCEGGRDSVSWQSQPQCLSLSVVPSAVKYQTDTKWSWKILISKLDQTWLTGWLGAGQAIASQDPINCISTFF